MIPTTARPEQWKLATNPHYCQLYTAKGTFYNKIITKRSWRNYLLTHSLTYSAAPQSLKDLGCRTCVYIDILIFGRTC
jgi:hypothetical protein